MLISLPLSHSFASFTDFNDDDKDDDGNESDEVSDDGEDDGGSDDEGDVENRGSDEEDEDTAGGIQHFSMKDSNIEVKKGQAVRNQLGEYP